MLIKNLKSICFAAVFDGFHTAKCLRRVIFATGMRPLLSVLFCVIVR